MPEDTTRETDGDSQKSTDYLDRYETATYNGAEYPAPGDWWLDDVAGAGVGWMYDIPRTDDGEPDFTVRTWDCPEAYLVTDWEEPIETLTFRIEQDEVFAVAVDERGEGRHSPWTRIEPVWQSIAEALHSFHTGEDYTAIDCPDLVGEQTTDLGDFDG